MFNPQHFGLYFTAEQVGLARSRSNREPFKTALAFLRGQQPDSGLSALLVGGLRYRFDGDVQAGEQAVHRLEDGPDMNFDDDAPYLDTLANMLTLAQCFEMLRDHPAFSPDLRRQWLDTFSGRVEQLNQTHYEVAYAERLWLGALDVGAGIVLEREEVFQAGVEVYQRAVHDDVRPEGYIPRAVEGRDGQTLHRQLLAVSALVLMAEAASHAGVNLWDYHHRGVSVITAAAYLIYYYFYPDQWRWDDGLELAPTQRLFRQHGGFLEMVNRRNPPKGIQPLLDDLRPIHDLHGGGLTTLTHGVPARRGLFG